MLKFCKANDNIMFLERSLLSIMNGFSAKSNSVTTGNQITNTELIHLYGQLQM